MSRRRSPDSIDDRSARGIAAAVGRMITCGDLAVGTRLADRARAVQVTRRLTDDRQRGVADA